MINELKRKIVKWLGIDRRLLNQNDYINKLGTKISNLEAVLKERTEYHVDVHQYSKRNSQVILIGKYNKRDFVKCYEIPDQEFKSLINHLRELEKYAGRGKIDAPPEASACIKSYL